MTFLDTNVILRYLIWDEPQKAKKCETLFKTAIEGKEILYTSTLVITELVWVLEKAYKFPKIRIITYVQKILNTPNINLKNNEKDILFAAIGLYELKNIDFIDAYNAIFMETEGIGSIYSYDPHFDLAPPLKRLEP